MSLIVMYYLYKTKRLILRLKRKVLKRVWLVRALLILFCFLIVFLLTSVVGRLISSSSIPKYFSSALDFIYSPNEKIRVSNDRVNILLLGKGGGAHDAPDLTDTIMIVSLGLKDKTIKTVSVPRDIWIDSLKAKVNSSYYWGKIKEDKGMLLAKSVIEDLFDIDIAFVAVLDFDGFKEIIDNLGGIYVDVENSFVDEKFPIAGKENDLCGGDLSYACRYEKIEFKKGLSYMDGTLALKFVRSRYSSGDEGTDIARSVRQQKVIAGIKNKVLSPEFLFSPNKILRFLSLLDKVVERDIKQEELVVLARKFLDSRNAEIKKAVVPQELLFNPPVSKNYNYQYVFVVKNKNELVKWINDFLYN